VLVDSPDEQTTNQSQLDWIANVARKLTRGFVLTIDYGFPRTEFCEVVQVRAKHRDSIRLSTRSAKQISPRTLIGRTSPSG